MEKLICPTAAALAGEACSQMPGRDRSKGQGFFVRALIVLIGVPENIDLVLILLDAFKS